MDKTAIQQMRDDTQRGEGKAELTQPEKAVRPSKQEKILVLKHLINACDQKITAIKLAYPDYLDIDIMPFHRITKECEKEILFISKLQW